MADHELRFQILGPLLVTRGGRPLQLPKSAVLRGLLGTLLLADAEPLAAHRLRAAVWADHDGRVSSGAVQVGVSRLRAWLRDNAGSDTAVAIEHTGDGYRLTTAPDAVDLGRLRTLLATAEGTADPVRRYELLIAAMQLRRGAVLADLTGVDMSDGLFRSAEDSVRACGLAFASAALAAGRPADAVIHVEELAAAAPFDEPIHACLIDLLAAAEQPAAALACYEGLRGRLADEFGVAPSEAVQRAHLDVLARDRQLAASEARDGDDDGVDRPADADVPAQLPMSVTGFTGRAAHLAHLDALLPGSGATAATIVVIDGTAGVGKTALAVHWAHLARDRFPDGQLYVNLRGFAPTRPMPPVEAVTGFLRALGEPAEGIPAETDEAAALYRTRLADKRVLVVLDNAHDVAQVRPLLPASTGCLVLVTSRNRLAGLVAREGAHRISLDVLSAREATLLLAETLGAERVRAEPRATADLARACAHLPLALRIAAANLTQRPAYSVNDYVAELGDGDRLAALRVEGDEHSAVRAAFGLSYTALDPEARRMFRLLGLLPGHDVSPAAAAALAGMRPGPARGMLDRLAAAALITEHAPGRYAFHDLLGLYAAECAQEEPDAEREAAIRRLFAWYLRGVDAAARQLYPSLPRVPHSAPDAGSSEPVVRLRDSGQALAWLEAERANLIAIVAHTATHGPRPVAWLLADGLRGYLWLRASPLEWQTVAEAGLAAAEAEGDPRARAACHLNLGLLHRRCSRYEWAVEHFAATAELCDADGWPTGRVSALGGLSATYWMMGELELAADHGRAALDLSRQIGSVTGQSSNLGKLGMIYRAMGRLPEAAEHHEQALILDRETGNRVNESYNLRYLGETYHALGRSGEARASLNRALELLECLGDRNGQGETYNALAALHRDTGRLDHALDDARTALDLARDTGERRLEAEVLNTVASIQLRRDDPADALDRHRQALELARATGARSAEIHALVGLAAAESHLGRTAEARTRAQQAVTLAREAGFRLLERQALETLDALGAAGSVA